MFAYDKINQTEGLIYIHDYNIPDIEGYGSELKKEYNLLDVKKKNLDKNQKHHFYSTTADFQRKRTTETHRNPGLNKHELKFTNSMKDQWAARHVLDMDTQWKYTVKQSDVCEVQLPRTQQR